MRNFRLSLAITAVAIGSAGAYAASAQETASVRDEANIVKLSDFDVGQYRDGWLADTLRGSTVYGRGGDQVGTVQSIIVGTDGTVDRLVIETGGFLDIGDKVFSVSWSEIDITPGEDGIKAPNVSEDNLADFSLFNDRESAQTGPRSFRTTELIGDYVTLSGGEEYGYVRDLLFDREGKLQSIVVEPDVGYDSAGYYAYPYYGYGYDYSYDYDPGLDYYGLPYGANDLTDYEPFDYGAFDDGIV